MLYQHPRLKRAAEDKFLKASISLGMWALVVCIRLNKFLGIQNGISVWIEDKVALRSGNYGKGEVG